MNPRTFNKDLLKRLAQKTYWIDAKGTRHHVDYMSQSYCLNALLWLEDRADDLFLDAVLDAHLSGDAKAKEILHYENGKQWLHNTPLVERLRGRLDKKHLTAMFRGVPACEHCHDFIEGTVYKQYGKPYHFACRKHREKQMEKEHVDHAFQRYVIKGLNDAHRELRAAVPGMLSYIDDQAKLEQIVHDVQTLKASDILVLGAYLATEATDTLERWQAGKPPRFAEEFATSKA